jgi:predicted enzyme related to lactoylglutathione lyase
MTSSAFSRYDLRTLDPDGARSFYADALGLELGLAPPLPADPSTLAVWLLHEQARKRGAPAHWLGQIDVGDVELVAGRMVERGGERLGPTIEGRDGVAYATLRDPFGAVLAVRTSVQGSRRQPVAWHHLHTRDLDEAWRFYSELFGWTHTETLDVADPPGGFRMFAWEAGGASVGSMANTARWPGVHTHWLYYFPVLDLEGVLAKIREKGGRVQGSPAVLSSGDRLAACEDPQGAAFGLRQIST